MHQSSRPRGKSTSGEYDRSSLQVRKNYGDVARPGRLPHETSVDTIVKLFPYRDVILKSDIATYHAMGPEGYRRSGLPDISQKEWDALASIYLRQWFNRVWVLQEIVLAQSVVCFCGPHQIPWHFVQATRVLDELEQRSRAGSFRYIPPDGTPWQIERNFTHMLSCRERRMLDELTPEHRETSSFYRGPGKRCQKPLARLVLDSWTSVFDGPPRQNLCSPVSDPWRP